MLLWLLLSNMLILLMLLRVWAAVKRLERLAHIEHLALVVDMADENKTERVQLLMTPSEVKAIDDWSFENRIRGRAEAMRRLCQIGLYLDKTSQDLYDKLPKSPSDADKDSGFKFAFIRAMLALTMMRDLPLDEDPSLSLFEITSQIYQSLGEKSFAEEVRKIFAEQRQRREQQK